MFFPTLNGWEPSTNQGSCHRTRTVVATCTVVMLRIGGWGSRAARGWAVRGKKLPFSWGIVVFFNVNLCMYIYIERDLYIYIHAECQIYVYIYVHTVCNV